MKLKNLPVFSHCCYFALPFFLVLFLMFLTHSHLNWGQCLQSECGGNGNVANKQHTNTLKTFEASKYEKRNFRCEEFFIFIFKSKSCDKKLLIFSFCLFVCEKRREMEVKKLLCYFESSRLMFFLSLFENF